THEEPVPPGPDSPAWLPLFLAAQSKASRWNLSFGFFLTKLESGEATVMLDGLDEAPDRVSRARVSRLIENASRTFHKCRFVISSRPAAYAGDVVLPEPEFVHTQIDPLSDSAIATFLERWCEALYPNDPGAARVHCDGLHKALR